jgi:hypothetical protein
VGFDHLHPSIPDCATWAGKVGDFEGARPRGVPGLLDAPVVAVMGAMVELEALAAQGVRGRQASDRVGV